MARLYVSLSLVFMALTVMSCSLFEVRSDTYSTSQPEGAAANFRGTATLAYAWAQRLRPPQNLSPALDNLKEALTKYTEISSAVNHNLQLGTDELFETSFVIVATAESFQLTSNELDNVRQYLMNGGFILMDNVSPVLENSQSEASMRKMMRDALGSDARFQPIPEEHELYHIVFDFDVPPQGSEVGIAMPRTGNSGTEGRPQIQSEVVQYLEGIWIGERLVAVLSNKGYLHNWNLYENNEPQLKFGVNMVVYALLSGGIGSIDQR